MPTNKENNLEHNKRDFLMRIYGIDKNIESALRSLVSKISTLHTFESVSHSLSKLIRDELDPAFEKWTHEHKFKVGFPLSYLIHHHQASAIANLQEIGKLDQHDNAARYDSDDIDSERLYKVRNTCTALINFVFFCMTQKSTYEVGVTFTKFKNNDSSDMSSERKTVTKKDSKTHFLSEFPLTSPLQALATKLRDCKICLACGEPTMEAVAREILIETAVSHSIRKRLKDNKKFNDSFRGSTIYCEEHYEKTNGSTAGKKARRWRGMFISLLHAMRYKNIHPLMRQLISPGDELEFAKKAIRNRYCYKHLTQIRDKLQMLMKDETTDTQTLEQQIFESIRDVYLNILKLTPNPYDIKEEDHLILFQDEFITVLDGRKMGFTPLRVAVSKIDV